MNIKGKEGFINKLGTYGASSELIDCRSEGFLENIEDGIYSTVKTLIENGYLTVSSCQGHVNYNKNRTVTIQVEENMIDYFRYLVYRVNEDLTVSALRYLILDMIPGFDLYQGYYKNPKKIQFIFGSCIDSQTELIQKKFEHYIENGLVINWNKQQDWGKYEIAL